MITCRIFLLALSCAFCQAAVARVDPSRSSVTATFMQMNVPVQGRFHQFSADVTFTASQPETGSASVVIDTSSYDLGDESFSSEARGSAWFASASWPRATFRSTGMKRTGVDTFDVAGQMTIKGISRSVVIPVKYARQGSEEIFDGVLDVHRSQFKLGTGEWADSSLVGEVVLVRFHIVIVR